MTKVRRGLTSVGPAPVVNPPACGVTASAVLTELAGRTGAVGTIRRIRADGWAPPGFCLFSAPAGDTSAVRGTRRRNPAVAHGTGRAYRDTDRARLLAVSEALERYSSQVYDDRDFLVAAADELGAEAMDLSAVARCSARERAVPGCPVTLPNPKAPMRWTEAVDLVRGAEVLVPVVMVYLAAERRESERFWLPISTGCAAHETIEAALVNAICEVIERDAIALTWLQRLPLSPLDKACIPGQAAELMDWCRRNFIETYLFDATTDVGVPTVYCVQVSDHTDHGAQIVGCASDLDVESAVDRAVMECIGVRPVVHARKEAPRRYAEYADVRDGAVMMGRRSRRRAFGFLLDGVTERPPSRPAVPAPPSAAGELEFLLDALSRRGMSVYATDISVRELEDIGHVAVRVIIPELQPMSLRPLAQYRAHPRLYAAPRAMGHRVLPESRLNRWPQPIA